MRDGLCWRIGNGDSIKFWSDNWTGLGPLSSYALESGIIDNEVSAKDFWIDNDWNFQLLSDCLPNQVVDQIAKIPVSNGGTINDKLIWQPTL